MTLPSDVDCLNEKFYVCEWHMTHDCRETCAYAHDIRGIGIGTMTIEDVGRLEQEVKE